MKSFNENFVRIDRYALVAYMNLVGSSSPAGNELRLYSFDLGIDILSIKTSTELSQQEINDTPIILLGSTLNYSSLINKDEDSYQRFNCLFFSCSINRFFVEDVTESDRPWYFYINQKMAEKISEAMRGSDLIGAFYHSNFFAALIDPRAYLSSISPVLVQAFEERNPVIELPSYIIDTINKIKSVVKIKINKDLKSFNKIIKSGTIHTEKKWCRILGVKEINTNTSLFTVLNS